MIADRRTKQSRRRAAKPAVAAEHQDLCGGLVYDRERIALTVLGCDHPARELDHRAGHLLASRKLVDGGDRLLGGIPGAGHAEARERQHTINGPDRRVCARTDGVVPWNEDWMKTKETGGQQRPPGPGSAVRRESCESD